jgi:hypothetical protein
VTAQRLAKRCEAGPIQPVLDEIERECAMTTFPWYVQAGSVRKKRNIEAIATGAGTDFDDPFWLGNPNGRLSQL